MTPLDQKRAFNKLKHDLEPWRSLLVQMNSILRWEKKFYPAIIFVVISVFFMILWLLDLSTLTLLALAALLAVTLDSLFQTVSRFIYKTDNWDGNQEEQFENVITQICAIKITFIGCYDFLFADKERKSSLCVIIISVALLALAWLGAVFNNLLLMYLITISVVIYPGIREQHLFNALKEKFGLSVNSKLQQYREKSKNADISGGKME